LLAVAVATEVVGTLALRASDGFTQVVPAAVTVVTYLVSIVLLALVLKTLPTLEQIAKDAGRDLLRALDASYLLVSFPARSLGGRDKRMAAHYAQHFEAVVAAEGWPAERFEFASELAFLVRK
jgi:hypothetical protein